MPKKTTITQTIDLTSYKPKIIIPISINCLIAFGILVFTMVIYMLTNAKSISFWDSGEYIACSSILGIPHPPGNPFFIILGRFVSIFSFGFNHAALISFLSSLFGALAVMLTYLITVQLLSLWNEEKFAIITGGFIAAMLTAFSFSFWMNAVEAAVYTGMVFIVNLCIWLVLHWMKHQEGFSHQNWLLLIVYLLFLGFGIHQTALQIAPAILFIAVFPYIKNHATTLSFWGKVTLYLAGLLIVYIVFDGLGNIVNIPILAKTGFALAIVALLCYYLRNYIGRRAWLLGLLMVIIGFSTHLFLPIRAGFRPFINEGNPHNWDMFMDYVLRRQYVPVRFLERRGDATDQVFYHFIRYYTWQFLDVEVVANWFKQSYNLILTISNLLVTFLGLSGFYYAFKRNKNAFWYLFSLFFMTSIAMVFVMNLSNEEVRDRDYFFLTAYNIWAIAMGIGAVGVIQHFSQNKIAKYLLAILLMIYPIFNMVSQYHKHNRTGEVIALGYGLNLLNGLEENAIIFTNGDNDTFPIWYAQAVFDSHAIENMYPAENVFPSSRTNQLIERGLNWKSTHLKGIRQDVVVANLSLLNTPWFIKQLRDMDSIELNWTDEQIHRLRHSYLNEDLEVPVVSPNGERFSIFYRAGTIITPQDFAVARIIQDNFGKRPIYFAVTVSDYSGFEDYVIHEGMVVRLVSTAGEGRINYERLKNNVDNIYFYDGIFNEKLYKDTNKVNLIANYATAHLRLADYYQEMRDFDLALKYHERAMEFVLNPDERIRFYASLAISNAEVGNLEKADEFLQLLIAHNPDSTQPYIAGLIAMVRANNIEKALEYAEIGLDVDPFDRRLISLTFQIGFEYNMREEAADILTKILPFQPHLSDFIEILLDPTKTIDDL